MSAADEIEITPEMIDAALRAFEGAALDEPGQIWPGTFKRAVEVSLRAAFQAHPASKQRKRA